jgi:hypothetical protein
MVKERQILFSAPMVRAILAGAKTQTRRVVKVPKRMEEFTSPAGALVDFGCPYGKFGSRLWVREPWRVAACYDDKNGFELEGLITARNVQYSVCADQFLHGMAIGRYRHARFMPRWASRITLEITNVRVERLQDISEADAIAEGLAALTKDGSTIKYGIPDRDGLPGNDDDGWHWSRWCIDPRLAYQDLWESINGAGSWDANPFVWVIEFRRAA